MSRDRFLSLRHSRIVINQTSSLMVLIKWVVCSRSSSEVLLSASVRGSLGPGLCARFLVSGGLAHVRSRLCVISLVMN